MGKFQCAKIFKITGIVVALLLTAMPKVQGADQDFGAWVKELRRDALAKGIKPSTCDTAFAGVKPIPRIAAAIDCTAIIKAEGLKTTTEVVDHFNSRLLRVALQPVFRDRLIAFLDNELGTSDVAVALSYIEEPTRMLVHLIMSAPEYQLS